MLSNLDDQRAVWLQIRAFYGGGSRGQREEGDSSQNPPRVTEAEGESYLEPAAGPDQEPGAVVVAVTSDQWVAPSHLGEAGQSNPGTGRVASVESGTGAVAPGVLPGAAQGGLEPKGGRDLLGGPSGQRRGAASGKGGESRCTATGGARVWRRKGAGGPTSSGEAAGQGGELQPRGSSEEGRGATGTRPGPLGEIGGEEARR